jgi:predicted GNAT family acetyltransferase
MTVRVVNNPEQSRYEVWSDDALAGFSAYRERADRTIFTHTEIYDAFAGKGLAKVLARHALDDVVERGRVIVPVCPFIAAYIRKNSQYEVHVSWPENGES